jgi:hypothetical protein
MNDLESLCLFLAFLTGAVGGWELGGYRFTQRAFEFLRGKIR